MFKSQCNGVKMKKRIMRGNPSFSPFLISEEGDSKGQSPFVKYRLF
jgi:hypothetical protein